MELGAFINAPIPSPLVRYLIWSCSIILQFFWRGTKAHRITVIKKISIGKKPYIGKPLNLDQQQNSIHIMGECYRVKF